MGSRVVCQKVRLKMGSNGKTLRDRWRRRSRRSHDGASLGRTKVVSGDYHVLLITRAEVIVKKTQN